MSIRLLYLVLIVSLCLNQTYAQYYTPAQINLTNNNRLAHEGDFYLDTINNQFYIGLTNGSLSRIGDTLNDIIDSVRYFNDSIRIYERGNVVKAKLEKGGN